MKRKKTATHRRTIRRKMIKAKGGAGLGSLYVILIMLLLAAASFFFMGGKLPTPNPVQNGEIVIPVTNTPEPKKNNMQLYTFGFTTIVPTAPLPPSLCTNKAINNEPEILGYPNENTPTV